MVGERARERSDNGTSARRIIMKRKDRCDGPVAGNYGQPISKKDLDMRIKERQCRHLRALRVQTREGRGFVITHKSTCRTHILGQSRCGTSIMVLPCSLPRNERAKMNVHALLETRNIVVESCGCGDETITRQALRIETVATAR